MQVKPLNDSVTPSGGEAKAAIRVRWARPEEDRACKMLLPRAFGGKVRPVLFVAVTRDEASAAEHVIGAAALLPWPQGTPRGFKLALRVAKPFRGRGAGTALVEAAIEEARKQGMK